MQGALLGSFFLHAAIFYGLGRPGFNTNVSSIPKEVVLQVELLAATSETSSPVTEPALAPTTTALDPTLLNDSIPKSTPVADLPNSVVKQDKSELNVLPWKQQKPKVQKFPDLEYPPYTANITASLEIEVTLSKEGKATSVRVISESPQAMFTEWAWEMGMQGVYTPKITADGPVASTLNIRLDIAPGVPIEIR